MQKRLMVYSAPVFSLLLFLIPALNAHVLYAGEAEKSDEAKKEEKPKEQEFKYSAWCAFRDLSTEYIPVKDDKEAREKTTHTRPISAQWKGFGRRGMWTSVVLEMKNTTEKLEFKGSANIHVEPLTGDGSSSNKYETTYSQPFDLGPQTLKQYRFSVLCPEDGWGSLPFYVRGTNSGIPFERPIDIRDLDGARTDFILVISELAGGYRYLHPQKKIQTVEEDDGSFDRQVASVEPADLPTRWHDLMAANLVILDGPPREALTDAQWDALRGYVQAGGHLLITAGKDPQRLKGQIEDLAGITANEMAEVTSLDGDFALRPSTLQKEWKLPLVNVTVSPKGTPIISRNKSTQIVESVRRFYGTGSVTFLAYSLSDPALEGWAGRTTIPLSIISTERNRRLFRANVEEDLQQNQPGNPRNRNNRYNYNYNQQEQNTDSAASLTGFRKALDRSFANDTPVQLHSKALVMAFLLFYLLFAVPVSYFIFGWLGRRELAWIFVPIIAALFSGIGYYIGHYGQIGNLTVNEVSVIETGSGMDTGMARTFAAIYSPSRDDYSLTFPPVKLKGGEVLDTLCAPNHLLNPETLTNREIDAPTLSIRDLGQSFAIDDLRIQYRSTRHLEFLHRASLGEGLIANIDRLDNGSLKIYVENKVGAILLNPTLLYDGRALSLTQKDIITLQRGEVFEDSSLSMQDARWRTPDEAFFGKSDAFASARGKHITKRAEALNAYMRANTDRFRNGAVIAWTDGAPPSLPLEIKTGWGKVTAPRYEPITMIVLPLTMKKLRTIDTLPTELSLATSNSFDPGNQNWNDYSGNTLLQMQPWNYNNQFSQPVGIQNPQSVQIIYAKLELPKNYRDLAELGCRMNLGLKLEATVTRSSSVRPKQTGKPGEKVPMLDGLLHVQAFLDNGTGQGTWKDVSDAKDVRGAYTGYMPEIEKFSLPLDSPKATRNQQMLLRIFFVPNDQNGTSYQLRVRGLNHRIIEK